MGLPRRTFWRLLAAPRQFIASPPLTVRDSPGLVALTDIFHEVEEDLRRERLNKVWARYGSVFLTVAVLAVAGTAGFVWWRGQQQTNREAAAETFAAADDLAASGDVEGALKSYAAISASDGPGYPTLAMFRQASLLAAKNDIQGALAIYDKIMGSDADERLKSLAQIRAAFTVADTEDPEILKKRVQPFTGDDSPWRFEARELVAFADFRVRNNEASAAAYAAIAADEAAPATMRTRAEKMVSFLRGGAVLPTQAPAPVAPHAEVPAEAPTESATPAPTPQNR